MIRHPKCFLRLNEQHLSEGSIKEYQTQLFKDFSDDYNGTIIIVRSNHYKEFVFFMPHRFEETYGKDTDTQHAFYWINHDELVPCIHLRDHSFASDNAFLIWITDAMTIYNNRKYIDECGLSS